MTRRDVRFLCRLLVALPSMAVLLGAERVGWWFYDHCGDGFNAVEKWAYGKERR